CHNNDFSGLRFTGILNLFELTPEAIDLFSDERNVLNEKKKLLQDLSNKAGETAEESDATAISVTDLKELVDYYSSQTQDIALRLRGIERETTELREEINRLRRQLKEIQNPGKPQTRKIIVMAKADQGTRSQIQVDYLIGNAGWQPQYDIHASSDSTEIELTTYGVIRQRTGEDWEDVNLTLSTARPSVGTAIPELTPWTLDFFKPVERPKSAPADSYRSLAVAKSEVRSNYLSDESQVLEGEAELLESAQVMTSVIQSRGFNAVYVVPAKMSAPSDGEPHRCTVSIQKMESKRSYVSRPKLSRLVFMKATVTNANEAPLLPGQMNTFVDNDYIGRSYLNLVGPKGNFDLSLGQDDSIKVTRKEKVRKEDTRGILSRDRENQLGYTIEIENFKEEAVQLELEDQIPVSKDGQILVKAKKISPQPDKTKKETGKLTWNLELAGRQKKTIEVEFTVSHPPGQSIDGL
ncbi:MAG: DUF4139 domain-containing protein, partial [Verrucomicrobiota bacterium]